MTTAYLKCPPRAILGHGEDCQGWWVICEELGCDHRAEYADQVTARHRAAEHEEGHEMAEDQELERWVDWTLQSVAWHEERAEARRWEDGMGTEYPNPARVTVTGDDMVTGLQDDVPRVTEAERREALEVAAALEVAEDAPEDDEPEIVYSYTEPCMCGQIHPV